MMEVLKKNGKGRYRIFFKTDKGEVEVYFKKIFSDLYKPVVKSSEEIKEVPLLLEVAEIVLTLKKLYDVKKKHNINHTYNYGLLVNIVAGASVISMKTRFWNYN